MVLLDGRVYRGVGHIGDRPTFNEKHYHIEIHLFNFRGDLYGKNIRVFFVKHVRDTFKFEDAGSMVSRIKTDISDCLECLQEIGENEIRHNIKIF